MMTNDDELGLRHAVRAIKTAHKPCDGFPTLVLWIAAIDPVGEFPIVDQSYPVPLLNIHAEVVDVDGLAMDVRPSQIACAVADFFDVGHEAIGITVGNWRKLHFYAFPSAGSEDLVIGDTVRIPMRQCVTPMRTPDELLARLTADPAGLLVMANKYGVLRLFHDLRSYGYTRNDMASDFYTGSLAGFVQLIRDGKLVVDGENWQCKLAGHASRPAPEADVEDFIDWLEVAAMRDGRAL